MDRTRARPCAHGHVLPLPGQALPRRPPVPGGRFAGLHHAVRAGAAGDGGVRRAVGVLHVPGMERPAARLHLRQLPAGRGGQPEGEAGRLPGQYRQADGGGRDRPGGVAADHAQQHRGHLQPHLARTQCAAEAVALPGVLDGADAGRADGGGLAGAVGALLRAAGVRHQRRQVAAGAVAERGAGADRTGRHRGDLSRGAAPDHQVALRRGRRAAGHRVAGTGQVGPGRLPGQFQHLPEDLRRGGGRAHPAAVDLLVLGGGAAGCVAGVGHGGVPLPAGRAAPAAGLRDLRPAAHAGPLRAGACAGQGAAQRPDPGDGADADRFADPADAGPVGRNQPAASRRGRRVAAGARPGRPDAVRPVRSLPAAHSRRRSAPSFP